MNDKIELKISAEDMWSLIEMYPGKILLAVNDEKNGTDVIINAEGLEVHKGKFRMYNASGTEVLYCGNNGGVETKSSFSTTRGDNIIVSMNNEGIDFYNPSYGSICSIQPYKNGLNIDGDFYINKEKVEIRGE